MTGRPLHITIVEPDGMGGLIHYAYQLCAALAGAGADVTLITSRHYELAHLPHPFRVDTRMRLWPTVDIGRRSGGGRQARRLAAIGRTIRRMWRAVVLTVEWIRLTRHLLATRPDVVGFSTIRFPYLGLFLRRLRRAGLTLIQICHEWEFREARYAAIERVNRRLARAVYRCFSAIFLHGSANRTAFAALHPEVAAATLHEIPHGDESLLTEAADAGGDLRNRYHLDPEVPVAVFFGGLRPSKGIEDLVEAFALVRSEMRAALIVAGYPTGVDPDRIRAHARRLGVEDSVVVDGRYLELSEIGPLMRTATVVALPYRSATASGVLQTAYAFARPVIATTTGGLPEAVDHGRTGLLVPPRDPAALARALGKLLSDPAEAERMGREGASLAAEQAAWGPIATTMLDVLRETASGSRR